MNLDLPQMYLTPPQDTRFATQIKYLFLNLQNRHYLQHKHLKNATIQDQNVTHETQHVKYYDLTTRRIFSSLFRNKM